MLSLLFYIYTVCILTLFLLLSVVAFVVCYPFDPKRRVVHELSRMLCFTFWRVPFTWKFDLRGLDKVDPDKPYVIVINHKSMVDIITLYFLRLNFRWVSKEEVFYFPWIGQLLYLHGDIAIQRGKASVAMQKVMRDGEMWLKRGACVSIFPEGTRSKDGEIQRFKQGAFLLAKNAGVDILPVVMNGTTDVLRPNYLFNWRLRIQMSVLDPIPAQEVKEKDVQELMQMAHDRMVEEYDKIRK